MTAITDLSSEALTECYRRGALSPVEVARDCLARIERAPAFNAFMPLQPAQVMAEATASEARWHSGSTLGGLDGVPATALKAGAEMPAGGAGTGAGDAICGSKL